MTAKGKKNLSKKHGHVAGQSGRQSHYPAQMGGYRSLNEKSNLWAEEKVGCFADSALRN
jgi:hypothetical protein